MKRREVSWILAVFGVLVLIGLGAAAAMDTVCNWQPVAEALRLLVCGGMIGGGLCMLVSLLLALVYAWLLRRKLNAGRVVP